MAVFLKSAHKLALPDDEPCDSGGADADNLSKDLSKLVTMPESSYNLQGVVSPSTETCIIGATDADDLSTGVSITPGSSNSMQDSGSWDNQAGKMVASQNLRRMLTEEKRHAFWETQPVEQYQDREKNIEEEGPIAPLHNVAEVRTEPYKLPKHYEWCTCDVNCDDTMGEIYNLLSNHYVEDVESMFRCNYSKDFLR
eukprot:c17335_g1_i1 orf=3-590(-)